VTTVAGGSVLSVNPGKVKRSSPHLLPRLEAAAAALERDDELASDLLAGGPVLFRATDLARLSRMGPAEAEAAVAELVEEDVLEPLGGGSYVVAPRALELIERMAGELRRYHEAHACSWGMTATHVCEILDLPAKSFKGLARALRRDDRITLRHGHLARTDFEPALTAKQMEQKDAILRSLEDAGGRPPAQGDLARRLDVPAADMKLLVRLLTEEDLVRVVGSNLMSTGAYEEYRGQLLGLFETSDEVGLAEFREVTGLGRNLAWTLLEAFDLEGLTKKMGDVRVLVRSADGARDGDDG
jgi:selenocysteine-specific elongation factor